jgi:hypothetical protein
MVKRIPTDMIEDRVTGQKLSQSNGLNHMFFLADIRSQNTIEF